MTNYNENYEKDIQEIIKPIREQGLGYNYDYLFDELKHKYHKTNYPGYSYMIGFLFEKRIFKSENSKIHLHYYNEAAQLNYLPALIVLSQISLDNIKTICDHHKISFMNKENYKIIKEDKEGKYLLAKLSMIRQILDDELNEYFLGALSIMKESAEEGYEEANYFMNHCKI